MKIMEKKRYNKPEVTSTMLDSSINLVLMSENGPTPNNGPGAPNSPNGEIFINPFKWFK